MRQSGVTTSVVCSPAVLRKSSTACNSEMMERDILGGGVEDIYSSCIPLLYINGMPEVRTWCVPNKVYTHLWFLAI